MIHDLKVFTHYFNPIIETKKTFEYRKNDREFKVGDTLLLKEISFENGEYTGRSCMAEVTYILLGGVFHIPSDHCIMSFKLIENDGDAEISEVYRKNMESFIAKSCGRRNKYS